MSEFWQNIDYGKNAKPILVFDPSAELVYNINDPNGEYYMLNRDLMGCLSLPFSKRIQSAGSVTANGRSIPFVVSDLNLGGIVANFLGIKLGGVLRRYGERITLTVAGFVDTDGNTMDPIDIAVRACDFVSPDPKYAEHERVALAAAEEGIVLLKNDGALPFDKTETLNVFGFGAHTFRFDAVGAGRTNPRRFVGFLEAIRNSEFVLNDELADYYAERMEDSVPPESLITAARAKSDKAIMLISRAAGENSDACSDKGEYDLTDDENALLDRLGNNFASVIVILNVGYPISCEFINKKNIAAVLYNGFGGMLAGEALVNVLNGSVDPSGRLTDTWTYYYADNPSSHNFYDCAGGKIRPMASDDVWLDTVYEEDVFVGYRYYETFGKSVAFPFGFGLSYTDFTISTGKVQPTENGFSVYVDVKNVGDTSGKEVVQVYVKKPSGGKISPIKELVDFGKTKCLAASETQRLEFDVTLDRLCIYDEIKHSYIAEKGIYEVFVGKNVRSLEKAGEYALTSAVTVKTVDNIMQPQVQFDRLTADGKFAPQGKLSGIKNVHEITPKRKPKQYPVKFVPTDNKTTFLFNEVLRDPKKLDDFVSALDVKQLARLAICASSGWGMEGKGEAGRLYRVDGLDIPEFVFADGNSGVNLKEPNIGMPSGVTICSSFNKQLACQVGKTIGEEARELGVSLILAPAFNIHRNPLCGRQPEYFSEDPYLAGIMAANYCRGLESVGVGGCYKHLCCNNAETSRKRNQSIVSERALREIYLAAFRYAMQEYMPASFMTAYNAVNGVFTSEDSDLICGFLREECGFDGFVMTDWDSYETADIVNMQIAGNTFITQGSTDSRYTDIIEKGVADGRLSPERLRENVWYMLNSVVKLKRYEEKN